MGRLWVMDDYTQSRVFMKSIIAQITKAIKSTKRLPQIAIGSHHFLQLSCLSFALISPLMTINAKPSINIISIFDIKIKILR